MMYKILHIPTAKYVCEYSAYTECYHGKIFYTYESATNYVNSSVALREHQLCVTCLRAYDSSDDYIDVESFHFEIIEVEDV